MRKLAFPLTIGAVMVVVAMPVAPAQAQLAHTWVASNGVDSANCDRPTPCLTFAGAFTKTTAGGEITCVDSGNYAGVSITKSITINCTNAIGSSTNAMVGISSFVVATAATDVVILRGLDLDGLGFAFSGPVGMISFTGAGALHVDKVKINNLRGSGGSGIRFLPNGPARLDVSDSFIADNGDSLSTAGILIRPTGGGSANVSVSRTDLKGNVNGIFVDGSGGGAVNLSVRHSLVTGSSNVGIVLATSGPAVTALIDNTTVNSSFNVGVAASGAAATVRIGNSTIYGNVTGVAAFSGGTLRSFKNNQIKGNLTDGTPIATEGLD